MPDTRAPDEPRTFFLHVFNDQMHRNYGLQKALAPTTMAALLELPLKLAYLAAEQSLLIPTMDVVESLTLAHLLPHLHPLIQIGDVRFCGSAVDPDEFFRRKRQHYANVQLYPQYFDPGATGRLHSVNAGLITRTVRTTSDIANRWQQDIETTDPDAVDPGSRLLQAAYTSVRRDGESLTSLADVLHSLPSRLSGEALLWEIAERRGHLGIYGRAPFAFPLRLLLAQKWLLSHVDEYGAALLVNIPRMGALDCGLATGPVRHPACVDVRDMSRWFEVFNLGPALHAATFEELIRLRQSAAFRYFRRAWRRTMIGSTTVRDIEAESRIKRALARRRWASSRRALEMVGAFRYLNDRIHAAAEELSKCDDGGDPPHVEVRGGLWTRSVSINVGDVIGGSNVTVGGGTGRERTSIMGDKINITTGDITNSPGAVAVQSTIGKIDARIGELAAAAETAHKQVAEICAELKTQLEAQTALSFQGTLGALQDLETVVDNVGVEAGQEGGTARSSALGRLADVARQLDPIFTTTSALVGTLKELLGLG